MPSPHKKRERQGLEDFTRCRYYPSCRIHIGARRPREYSDELFQMVRDAFAQGWTQRDIRAEFGLTDEYAKAIRDGKVYQENGRLRWKEGFRPPHRNSR